MSSCFCRSTSKFKIVACTETSSAEVGSSHTTRFGEPANAREMATRCFSPPESWAGRALCSDASTRIPESNSCARLSESVRLNLESLSTARETMRVTLWRRLRAWSGFWNTICRAPTSSTERLLSARASFLPLSVITLVDSALVSPRIIFAMVVFPEPDSPTSPRVSPGPTKSETSFTT